MPDSRETDVVVVGAGLAGLAAARKLTADGIDCVVLEARDRVGGRTLNHSIGDGKIVEVGGQWVGPTQTRVLELMRELGLESFPTYDQGEHVIEYEGELKRYTGTIPKLSKRAARGLRPGAVEARPDGAEGSRRTRRGRRRRRRSGTARRSGRGCAATSTRRARATRSRSPSRRSGPRSPRTSRCCTCSSTSPRPAGWTRCGTPRAARRTRASSAARS